MNKQGLVYCISAEQYDIFDERISKPICIKQFKDGIETGSMVLQELDEINFHKNSLAYFPPNNVGLLLSINRKHLNEAKEIFKNEIDPSKINHSYVKTAFDKKQFLKDKSRTIADYIEKIQVCIVFGYTALEAFANLSIKEDFEYKVNIKGKGITELYDKKAIERWITLEDKLSKILTKIYETKKIEHNKFWSYFVKLEKYRHDIIHQKTIERTDFYKTYFYKDIFDVCACPEAVLKFFYSARSDKQKTNSLWPWLINKYKEFPMTTDLNSENFEVIGNLYEGKIKKGTN